MLNDINKEIRELKTTPRDLRNFGFVMAGALGILGLMLLWKHSHNAVYFLSVAGAFLVFSLILPRALIVLYYPWMAIAFVMGWFMTRVILSAAFFLVFTPIGLALRMFGKDLLDLKLDPDEKTYWKKHVARQSADSYRRPF
jgi:hypothetical protein